MEAYREQEPDVHRRTFKEVFSSLDNTDANQKENRKFFSRKYFMFSKFDRGIMIDKEGWYSVTPECMSEYLALRARDAFPEM